jgi:hypothetical protein
MSQKMQKEKNTFCANGFASHCACLTFIYRLSIQLLSKYRTAYHITISDVGNIKIGTHMRWGVCETI